MVENCVKKIWHVEILMFSNSKWNTTVKEREENNKTRNLRYVI